MASDYGLNFGFRRSDESMAVREGRYKTPATGTALLLGTAVEIDPAEPGYMKQSAAAAEPTTGFHGLLVQEESHIGSIFSVAPLMGHDSIDLGTAKLDQLSVIWSGAGTKVWFQNTPAYSRGTRSKSAVTIVTIAGVAVGNYLGWDGSKWIEVSAGATAWMKVTNVNTTTGYCEAVLQF